jgi:hypothetical protein
MNTCGEQPTTVNQQLKEVTMHTTPPLLVSPTPPPPVNPTSPNFLVSDPREIADQVAESELATAIAWTRFYLEALKDRQESRLKGTRPLRRIPEFHRDTNLPANGMGDNLPAIDLTEHMHLAEESQLVAPPLQDPPAGDFNSTEYVDSLHEHDAGGMA